MKINPKELSKFLNRIQIEKMITELPVVIENNKFMFMTTDSSKQVVASGTILLPNAIEKDISFSFPILSKLIAILDEFDDECELTIENQHAAFSDPEKCLKTEITKTTLLQSILANVDFNRNGNSFSLKLNGNIIEYNDSIKFNGKEFQKILNKCKVVKSPFYLIQQLNNELIVSAETKSDSMKFKCDFKSKFYVDKTYWLIEFVKEIFKKNPIDCELFINDRHMPVILDTFDANAHYNHISFLIAPKS